MTIWRYPHATFMNFIPLIFYQLGTWGRDSLTISRCFFFREEIDRDVIEEYSNRPGTKKRHQIKCRSWPSWIDGSKRPQNVVYLGPGSVLFLDFNLNLCCKLQVCQLIWIHWSHKLGLLVISQVGVPPSRPFETWRRNGSAWFWREPSQLHALARQTACRFFWWLSP